MTTCLLNFCVWLKCFKSIMEDVFYIELSCFSIFVNVVDYFKLVKPFFFQNWSQILPFRQGFDSFQVRIHTTWSSSATTVFVFPHIIKYTFRLLESRKMFLPKFFLLILIVLFVRQIVSTVFCLFDCMELFVSMHVGKCFTILLWTDIISLIVVSKYVNTRFDRYTCINKHWWRIILIEIEGSWQKIKRPEWFISIFQERVKLEIFVSYSLDIWYKSWFPPTLRAYDYNISFFGIDFKFCTRSWTYSILRCVSMALLNRKIIY